MRAPIPAPIPTTSGRGWPPTLRRSTLTALGVASLLFMGPIPLSQAAPSQAAPTVPAQLLEVTSTADWPSPSPDPTGLTFMRSRGRLLVSDAEVDEIPRLWKRNNLFVASRHGALLRRGSVRAASTEPEDIAWRDRSHSLFVVDDDRDRVFRIRAGRDNLIGTADDRWKRVLRTRSFGSFDPEGLAWRERGRTLILTDSRSARVFIVRAGRDHRFGTRDDGVRRFSTKPLGLTHPEDVEFDPRSNHLLLVSSAQEFVAETTLSGRLLRMIDFSNAHVRRASGITLAPSPSDPSVMDLYIVGKGVDNESDPLENDGELFRFAFPS